MRAPLVEVPYHLLRRGPERLQLAYEGRLEAEKERVFEQINRDRHEAGLPPLARDARAEQVGDAFCLDMAVAAAWGHWDLRGRAPWLRWGEAGGVDYHFQNVASFSTSAGVLERPVGELALSAHASMMREQPPHDGHRRAILDPLATHVGIGLAAAAGELRLSEEFLRVLLEWVEVPDRVLQAGAMARVAGQPRAGWEVTYVEIRHEDPPRPISLRESRSRGSYAYPPVLQGLTVGQRFREGALEGLIAPRDANAFEVAFPLNAGPGSYVVLAYVRPAGDVRAASHPATAALVVAR